MIAPARAATQKVLRAVHSGRADLPAALALVRGDLADPRDRALAAEVATGVLRMRNALDRILADRCDRALGSTDPVVLDVLRAAAYQLVYLDRVPDHAVVNDAVALTRQLGRARAAGFVNAILRRLTATSDVAATLPTRPALTEPPTADWRDRALDYLSVTLSHPRWLVERWVERFGFDAAERWAQFNNTPAPLTLRVNSLTTDRDTLAATLRSHGVETIPGAWSAHTLRVTGGRLFETPVAGSKMFLIQDEASQLVAELVDAQPGQRVLDLCAAPGGKTVAIAASLGGDGVVVASDLRPHRLSLLRASVEGLRCPRTCLVRCDARLPLPFKPIFDWVLVDAPCSGLGIVQRDPDIKWRRTPGDLKTMSDAQHAMLTAAAAVLAPGGRLVYATCSSEPEENQEVIERLRKALPTLVVERPRRERLAPLIDDTGYFQTLPFRDGLNAFFGAILRCPSDADTERRAVRYTGSD